MSFLKKLVKGIGKGAKAVVNTVGKVAQVAGAAVSLVPGIGTVAGGALSLVGGLATKITNSGAAKVVQSLVPDDNANYSAATVQAAGLSGTGSPASPLQLQGVTVTASSGQENFFDKYKFWLLGGLGALILTIVATRRN